MHITEISILVASNEYKIEPFKTLILAPPFPVILKSEPKLSIKLKIHLIIMDLFASGNQNLDPGEYLKFARNLGKIKDYPNVKRFRGP